VSRFTDKGYELADQLEASARAIRESTGRDDPVAVLASAGAIPDYMPDLVTDILIEAHDRGVTKKRIADLLGVSPRALRGL
jgi:hypothetical protein